MSEQATPDKLQQERARDIVRMMVACGARPPQAFVDHYIKTGILDGRLWPLRFPLRWEP